MVVQCEAITLHRTNRGKRCRRWLHTPRVLADGRQVCASHWRALEPWPIVPPVVVPPGARLTPGLVGQLLDVFESRGGRCRPHDAYVAVYLPDPRSASSMLRRPA